MVPLRLHTQHDDASATQGLLGFVNAVIRNGERRYNSAPPPACASDAHAPVPAATEPTTAVPQSPADIWRGPYRNASACNTDCSICLEDLAADTPVGRWPCAHALCWPCVERVIGRGNLFCPMCREGATLRPRR